MSLKLMTSTSVVLPFNVALISFLMLPPLCFKQVASSFPFHKIPKNTSYNKKATIFSSSQKSSDDFKTYYYDQTLDHFSYTPRGYATFKQKYVVNSKYWGGAISNSPILAFLGAEGSLDEDLFYVGFLNDNAPHFKALQVYIEHRYYGESIPYGSNEEAMRNFTTRGYLNSAQALADYAEVLLHVKDKFSAQNSPVIVFGASYGGMLASWFRLKYPHIAVGALASSAPILYFDDITPQTGYYSVVSKVFKETSNNCFETIKASWSEIDRVASKPNGLILLSRRFKTCTHLKSSFELKDYLDSVYTEAAQYNLQSEDFVSMLCSGIDNAPRDTTDILGRIFSGLVSVKIDYSCYDTKYEYNDISENTSQWHWQKCSEMVMPIGWGGNGTMFPSRPFNLSRFISNCQTLFGALPPRPHWITTYFGGHDIKLVLHRFGSNIIFSNGLKDPYSIGGVLENISETVVAISSLNGSHTMDILYATDTDPDWLIKQRKEEKKTIEQWITKYYADLKLLKKL